MLPRHLHLYSRHGKVAVPATSTTSSVVQVSKVIHGKAMLRSVWREVSYTNTWQKVLLMANQYWLAAREFMAPQKRKRTEAWCQIWRGVQPKHGGGRRETVRACAHNCFWVDVWPHLHCCWLALLQQKQQRVQQLVVLADVEHIVPHGMRVVRQQPLKQPRHATHHQVGTSV